VKKIRFSPTSQTDVRAIDQQTAMGILTGLHLYAETGQAI
jgi:hypothetical protein